MWSLHLIFQKKVNSYYFYVKKWNYLIKSLLSSSFQYKFIVILHWAWESKNDCSLDIECSATKGSLVLSSDFRINFTKRTRLWYLIMQIMSVFGNLPLLFSLLLTHYVQIFVKVQNYLLSTKNKALSVYLYPKFAVQHGERRKLDV